jgi:hypothetical protein
MDIVLYKAYVLRADQVLCKPNNERIFMDNDGISYDYVCYYGVRRKAFEFSQNLSDIFYPFFAIAFNQAPDVKRRNYGEKDVSYHS